MPDEERIEQLELEVKVLRANNKGLKDKIDEQSKEIEELKEKRFTLFDITIKATIKINDKKWEDKIKAKIEELKDGTYDAKIVLQSLLEKE